MNRKFYYGSRLLYNLVRTPARKMVYFSRLHMPIIQNMSPRVMIRIFGSGKIRINKCVTIEDGVLIEANGGEIIIDGCFVNRNTTIVALDSIKIEEGVTIGPNVAIYDHDHNISKNYSKEDAFTCEPITIERKAWIGANVIVLKGVVIGHDSVVAAGSVVTKSVEPFSIVAGNPARIIAMRQ